MEKFQQMEKKNVDQYKKNYITGAQYMKNYDA